MVSEKREQTIKQKAISIQKEKAEMQDKEQKEYEEALAYCKLLSNRIKEIIDTANCVIKNGIKLPTAKTFKKHGYNSSPFADAFYHTVGFMGRGNMTPISYIGFINGGCCGCWDFYTNGKKFLLVHEKDNTQQRKADKCSLEKFSREFPQFEEAFYDWIDSGMNE